MQLLPCNAEISHYKVAEKLLEEGIIMVRILRNRPGVVLPDFLNTPIVNLNFSYRFGISDFEVDERGIRASLSFRGVPMFCDVPWEAICSIVSEKTDQVFVWINAFKEEEINRYIPPDTLNLFNESKNCSLLNEFSELREFAFDEALKIYHETNGEQREDEDDVNDEDSDSEEEDDDGPREFTPLHFV